MATCLLKKLLLIIISSGFFIGIYAEIKPPNYDFTMATLEPYFPGKKISDISKDKTIQSDIFEDNGNLKIWRLKIKKADYILDLYAQVKDDQVVDLYVRLPQHFIHDQLLKDLQNRYKKQDRFHRNNSSALYSWLNRDNNNILYHGSCSITCFPMFVEIVKNDKTVTPLYQKFNEALPKW